MSAELLILPLARAYIHGRAYIHVKGPKYEDKYLAIGC